eukprot:10047383-Karenia_brevis.AAC.1
MTLLEGDEEEESKEQQQQQGTPLDYPELSSSSTGGEGRWVGQKSMARMTPIKKRQAISRSPEPPTLPQQAQTEGNT